MVDRMTPDYMPLCFHECGTIPTVAELKNSHTDWVWFLTWHTNYITDENTPDSLNAIYNDEYVITLDELPQWSRGDNEA